MPLRRPSSDCEPRPLDRLRVMPKFQAPRGTRDLLPADMAVWRRLADAARRLAALYGYQPIDTPLFEDSAVFERGIGEVTDVVEKELLRIKSPGSDEDRWALRPEATAGICRANVELHLNTIGDANCRPAYIAALVEYMGRYADALSELDRHRLTANPLRVL